MVWQEQTQCDGNKPKRQGTGIWSKGQNDADVERFSSSTGHTCRSSVKDNSKWSTFPCRSCIPAARLKLCNIWTMTCLSTNQSRAEGQPSSTKDAELRYKEEARDETEHWRQTCLRGQSALRVIWGSLGWLHSHSCLPQAQPGHPHLLQLQQHLCLVVWCSTHDRDAIGLARHAL